MFTKISLDEIKKLSKLKGKEINEAKKILAFEVTKICRGQERKRSRRHCKNLFGAKLIDDRLPSYAVKSSLITNLEFSILDAIEKLNLVQ